MLVSKKRKQKKLRNNEYYDLQENFDELYAQSKDGKIFDNLVEIISSEENIKLAYRNIKGNKGSRTAGVDKLNIEDLAKISESEFVKKVRSKLEWYKPKAVRRVEIPKPGGKLRPLGIPAIWDRIVQQCILQVLEPICEAKFHERSQGFRPNRSAEHAIADAMRMVQRQHLNFVIDVDIKGFFDNVNHTKLIKQMWRMGIRDKKLICIIKEMLKAPIILPNGEKIYPTKGTPQGGILSPLLANIVLNELDWWLASQWEEIPTRRPYKLLKSDGKINRNVKYHELRKTKLKEILFVRYADDFKVFCRTREDANKVFIAVKKWLLERLKLEINEEKSKVVNLKKKYSEFLGFKMKVYKKGEKYVVESHMSDKAVKKETESLIKRLKYIQNPRNKKEEAMAINYYNSTVWGIHNYYKFATHINLDCNKIQRPISTLMENRLKGRLKRNGGILGRYIQKQYRKSKQMRFISGMPICPIGYIQTKNAMNRRKTVCKYTAEGRAEIHKNLKFDTRIMQELMRSKHAGKSIEYFDNRVSLYCAQEGKCAVTGQRLGINEIHCHHKIPVNLGGDDGYQNLVIVHKDVHKLIHATQEATISKYLNNPKLTAEMISKVNKLRKFANLKEI